MIAVAQIAAVLAYLVPVAAFVILGARRDGALWRLAALIPAGVAVDLLVTLALCRFMRLELAAFASRAIWIAGAIGVVVRRRRRGWIWSWPAALDRRSCVALALCALTAAALSVLLSRPFAIWDRELHIPLVSSLRGQQLPFSNVFEPAGGLHYHFTGDVLAAMVQTFSFAAMNASLALSVAHDVLFVLIALTLGLTLLERQRIPPHLVVLGVVAVLLSGPCLLRFGVGEPFLGYNYYGLYNWAYRPHLTIELLMLSGLIAVLLGRSTKRQPAATATATADPAWQGVGPLVAMIAILTVTDETSTSVLGLCLGMAWLVEPRVIAPTRRAGALVLGALAAIFLATNLFFDASLAPGGPVQKIALVAPRSGGVQQPPLSLSQRAGWIALAADTVPIWVIGLAIAITVWRGRRAPDAVRPGAGVLAFLGALGGISLFALTCVEVNRQPEESHRFLTAAIWIFPAVGVLAFDWWPPATARRTLVFAALGLGAFSTLLWLSHYPKHPTPERWFRNRGPGLHDTSCRASAGARLGQRPDLLYVESSVLYSYAGCRPTFIAGKRGSPFAMKLRPTPGLAGFQQLNAEMLAPDAPIDAICPTGRPPTDVDPVCQYALTRIQCLSEGEAFQRCALTPADRQAIIAGKR